MYYIKGANKIYGPLTAEKVRTLLSIKRITLDVPISTDQQTWLPLKSFPELVSSDAAQDSSSPDSTQATPVTTATPVTVGSNTGSTSSSGSMSFDFLQNNNSSASSSGNANNPFAQQQLAVTPTPVQTASPAVPVPEEQWYISTDGVNGYGPYPTSQIIGMIQNGQILSNNLAWRNGENAVQISAIPSFANYFNFGAPNFNGSMGFSNNSHSSRGHHRYHGPRHSRTTYILLGLFFGCLGMHNFYAGYSGRGAIQLISTLLCIGWAFVPLWVLIEVCTETRDGNGVPFE